MSEERGRLLLTCKKCTRTAVFAGTMESASAAAKARGWVKERGEFVCPRCPAIRSVQRGVAA